MKKITNLIILVGGINLWSFSQTLNHQEKVMEYLGSDRFNELQQTDPGLIRFLESKAEFGFEIIEVIQGKEADFVRIEKVQVHSKNLNENVSAEIFLANFYSAEFNFLMYVFPSSPDLDQYFLLGDTGKAIVIHSVNQINSKIVQP